MFQRASSLPKRQNAKKLNLQLNLDNINKSQPIAFSQALFRSKHSNGIPQQNQNNQSPFTLKLKYEKKKNYHLLNLQFIFLF